MPLSAARRSNTLQSHDAIPLPCQQTHDGNVPPHARHQFWLADLKASECALAGRPATCSSSTSSRLRNPSLSPASQMHYHAAELAAVTERFRDAPRSPDGCDAAADAAAACLTDADLLAMSRLSRDIASSLAEVTRHHRRREGRGSRIAPPPRRELERLGLVRGSLEGSKRGSIRGSFFSCGRCHTDASPQWRRGPDGPGTLCNVCGLLYARREKKRRLAWRRASPRSSSGEASWR